MGKGAKSQFTCQSCGYHAHGRQFDDGTGILHVEMDKQA